MSNNYFEQGEQRIPLVELAFNNENWPIVAHEAQEAVELLLKGALRAVGIEPAATHDVGTSLELRRDLFPPWLARHIPCLSVISQQLAEDRGPSFYGDERRNILAEELYFEPEATEALERLRFVHQQCARLIEEFRACLAAREEGNRSDES